MTLTLKLDDYLPYRLSVASNEISRLIAKAYADRFGLSIAQWRLICVLAEDGSATPQSLVARTAMDKVMVSRASAGLLTRRLIGRAPNPEDARSHHLALTPQGRALFEEVAPTAIAYERALLATLDADEIAGLKQTLKRLEAVAQSLSAGDVPSLDVSDRNASRREG